MENIDFSGILKSLSDMLGGVDFSSLLASFTEMAKKLIEMIGPLLSNLNSGSGTGTTDPTKTA